MLYYQLTRLRKDPYAFYKVLLFCVLFHVLILVCLLFKRVSLINTFLAIKPATVTLAVAYRPSQASKTIIPQKRKTLSSVSAQKAKKKIVSLKLTPIIKQVEKKSSIASGASSKLVLPSKKTTPTKPVVQKKVVSAQLESKKPVAKKTEKTKPVEIKKEVLPVVTTPVKKIETDLVQKTEVEMPKEQPVPIQKTIVVEPELQTMVLGDVAESQMAGVPDWLGVVQASLGQQLGEFKFLKDSPSFSYTALLAIDAEGRPTIGQEEGCSIPTIRASIKKIYLSYRYPKDMWNKIWPIAITKHA